MLPTALTLDRAIRALVVVLLFACACEMPVAVPPSTPSPTPPAAPTARPTPAPQRYSLLFGEFPDDDKKPMPIRVVSLNSGDTRDIMTLAPKHDGRFAIHPDGMRMAVLDKEDHHRERTATWRLDIFDLGTLAVRNVISERTEPDTIVPCAVGWTSEGALLIASRPGLDRVDELGGSSSTLERFPDGPIGV